MAPRPPDFLIVGTMKSGTSSLAAVLRQHPRIALPAGELHFFDDDERYARGLDWYCERLAATSSVVDGDVRLGEKTPTYSYLAPVPARIRAALPSVRLVWIFREPVARAFSNYLHRWSKGTETLSFAAAVEREAERIAADPFCGYVERSRYDREVRRYREHFPPESMHYLLFEELLAEPGPVLARLTEFLGVEPFADPPELPRANPTVLPRSPASLRWARRLAGEKSRLYRAVRGVNRAVGRPKPRLDPALAAELAAGLEPHKAALAELTGLDTDRWW